MLNLKEIPIHGLLTFVTNESFRSKDNFTERDQIRLAKFCKRLDSKGAKFLLSNSDPKNEKPVSWWEIGFFQLFECLDAAIQCYGLVALFLQYVLQILPGNEFVFDNKYRRLFHAKGLSSGAEGFHGNRIINRVPSPSLLSTEIVP